MTIYHNPRCSKSRQTLELLKEKGHDPAIRLYLDEPLSPEELKKLITMSKHEAADFVRIKDDLYKEDPFDTSDSDTVITKLGATAKLMERPVLEANGTAIICRPPERALEIL